MKEELGGGTASRADPKWCQRTSHSTLSSPAAGGGGRGTLAVCLSAQVTVIPAVLGVLNPCLPWGSGGRIPWFALLAFADFYFTYQTVFMMSSLILPSSSGE